MVKPISHSESLGRKHQDNQALIGDVSPGESLQDPQVILSRLTANEWRFRGTETPTPSSPTVGKRHSPLATSIKGTRIPRECLTLPGDMFAKTRLKIVTSIQWVSTWVWVRPF